MLKVDLDSGIPSSSWSLFKSIGIPHCHAISYLTMHCVGVLPLELTCGRWKARQCSGEKDLGVLLSMCNQLFNLTEGKIEEFEYMKKILTDSITKLSTEVH